MRISPRLLIGVIIVIAGCGDDRRDVRDFYFPVRQLTDGLVYEYRAVNNDTLPPVHWYYLSAIQDTGVYLTATDYGTELVQRQLVREELLNEGMILNELYLYEPDTAGRQQRVQAEVLAASVFPFYIDVANPGIYLYKVRFQLPSQRPNATTTLIVNRQYVGDTTFTFEGRTYDALRLQLKGVVSVRDSVLGDIEPRYDGEEIYARGLGLVEYWRTPGPQRLHYRLAERYGMKRLEEKAKSR